MISDEELDLMKRQNERNSKYLHRMGRDGVRANRHRTALLAEVDRLRAELEVERLRLAACDVVAMADTPESAIKARQIKPDYRSAALTSVERRVDEVIALRAEIERLREVIRTIRARCVELDDSDAVSETLDIATAVLEDEPCA